MFNNYSLYNYLEKVLLNADKIVHYSTFIGL